MAILAFLSAIVGLIAFYKKMKKESLVGTAADAIGFISILILRLTIKIKWENKALAYNNASYSGYKPYSCEYPNAR